MNKLTCPKYHSLEVRKFRLGSRHLTLELTLVTIPLRYLLTIFSFIDDIYFYFQENYSTICCVGQWSNVGFDNKINS